jgi:hypothetical protein
LNGQLLLFDGLLKNNIRRQHTRWVNLEGAGVGRIVESMQSKIDPEKLKQYTNIPEIPAYKPKPEYLKKKAEREKRHQKTHAGGVRQRKSVDTNEKPVVTKKDQKKSYSLLKLYFFFFFFDI